MSAYTQNIRLCGGRATAAKDHISFYHEHSVTQNGQMKCRHIRIVDNKEEPFYVFCHISTLQQREILSSHTLEVGIRAEGQP